MGLINFSATEDQVKQVVANAVNASRPMGLGYLHFQERTYDASEFNLRSTGIYLDYHDGRMVKLGINKNPDGTWRISDSVDVEYQSWARVYPDTVDLLASAGIAV